MVSRQHEVLFGNLHKMMTIKELYEQYCDTPSDINEHLKTLRDLVSGFDHITEMWVRTWLSTVAMLAWLKDWARLVSFDIVGNEDIAGIDKMAKLEGKKRNFRCEDTLKCDIEYTDVLFIDTWHCYDQLIAELTRHAPRVKKYIAMHDTTTYWEVWEVRHEYPCKKDHYDWLKRAINEFLNDNHERSLKIEYTNNNWLTILERDAKNSLEKPNKLPEKIKVKKWEVIVYTAISGWHDVLKKQPEQSVKCRFICFTDWPIKIEVWAKWEVIDRREFMHLHPRLRAKWYRLNPWELFEWDWIIMYMDWSWELKSKDSVKYFTSQLLPKSDILCFKHVDRNCIFEEAKYCMDKQILKYRWLPLIQQAQYYMDHWHPKNRWLSATGLLVYRLTDRLINFFHERYYENLLRTYQDQISYDYLIRKLGIKRQRLKDNQRDNEYITFLHPHIIES